MITLRASENYNSRFAPPGAKKAYIARITGRDSKMTFAREFLGKESVDVDTPGLYETRSVDKKGRPEDPDYILICEVNGETRSNRTVTKEDAMKIAKALDQGRTIDAIVEMTVGPVPEGKQFGATSYSLITSRQAETSKVAQTIDTAVDGCWRILQVLPPKEAKKVLSQLRVRVSPPNPPTPTVAPLVEEAPVGMVSDRALDHDVSPATLGLTPTPVAEESVAAS